MPSGEPPERLFPWRCTRFQSPGNACIRNLASLASPPNFGSEAFGVVSVRRIKLRKRFLEKTSPGSAKRRQDFEIAVVDATLYDLRVNICTLARFLSNCFTVYRNLKVEMETMSFEKNGQIAVPATLSW